MTPDKSITIFKAGSDAIVNNDWNINTKLIKEISYWIRDLHQEDKNAIVLTSWAVARWLAIIWKESIWWLTKAALSTIWQGDLMRIYSEIFQRSWLKIWQCLNSDPYNSEYVSTILKQQNITAPEQIETMLNALQQQTNSHITETLLSLLSQKIVAVKNYNDYESSKELSQLSDNSDNDNHALFITKLIHEKVERVVLFTGTRWVLDQDWNTIQWCTFEKWNTDEVDNFVLNLESNVNPEMQSKFGRWWMLSKIRAAWNIAKLWIDVHIAYSGDWLNTLSQDWISTKFLFD